MIINLMIGRRIVVWVLAKAHEESLPPYCDIVVRAKPSAASASFSSLDEQFATGFAKVAHKAE